MTTAIDSLRAAQAIQAGCMALAGYWDGFDYLPPDWILSECVDQGRGHYYRFRVTGVNTNYPPGAPFHDFTWTVPSIDSYRYDLTGCAYQEI